MPPFEAAQHDPNAETLAAKNLIGWEKANEKATAAAREKATAVVASLTEPGKQTMMINQGLIQEFSQLVNAALRESTDPKAKSELKDALSDHVARVNTALQWVLNDPKRKNEHATAESLIEANKQALRG